MESAIVRGWANRCWWQVLLVCVSCWALVQLPISCLPHSCVTSWLVARPAVCTVQGTTYFRNVFGAQQGACHSEATLISPSRASSRSEAAGSNSIQASIDPDVVLSCAGVGSLPLGMPAELFAGASGMSLPQLQQGGPALFGVSPSGSGGTGGLQSIELFQRSGLRPLGGSLPLHLPRSGGWPALFCNFWSFKLSSAPGMADSFPAPVHYSLYLCVSDHLVNLCACLD